MKPDARREYVEYVGARLHRLHHAAYLLCGDGHRADDLVQVTLTDLYRSWSRARRADNLDGYVHRILVRRHLDERRRSWSRVVLRDAVPEPAVLPASGVEDRDQLVRALRAIPAGQRAVLVLRYFSDLSVEETAAVLGCTSGNVKSQSARGLAALRQELGPAAPGGAVPLTRGAGHG